MERGSNTLSADTDILAPCLNVNSDDAREPNYLGLSLTNWLKIGIVALLMAATFRFNLVRLYLKTNPFTGEANWGHSVCIPLIGLYYLYLNREELLKTRAEPLLGGRFTRARLISSLGVALIGLAAWFVVAPRMPASTVIDFGTVAKYLGIAMVGVGALALLLDWGLAMLIFGLLVFQWGIYPGRNDWTSDMGIPIALFGVVLTLGGWKVMRIAWFPILFLVCAIPLPGLVYSKIASPLQVLAARVAVFALNLSPSIDAAQSGTKILMGPTGQGYTDTLNVAEACAGLRSLMTFISIGAAVAFLSSRPLWQKIIITLSAIPIAIFCNVMRVAGQGYINFYIGKDMAEGFAHQFVGMVMLLPAFFLILGVAWVLDQIFVEEVDEHDEAAKKQPAVITRRQPAMATAQPGILIARRNIARPMPPTAQEGGA